MKVVNTLPDVGQHGSVVEDRDGGLGVKKGSIVEDRDGLGVKKGPLWEAPAWGVENC
jgi:hypothetical protein